jgi:hypothetical protein
MKGTSHLVDVTLSDPEKAEGHDGVGLEGADHHSTHGLRVGDFDAGPEECINCTAVDAVARKDSGAETPAYAERSDRAIDDQQVLLEHQGALSSGSTISSSASKFLSGVRCAASWCRARRLVLLLRGLLFGGWKLLRSSDTGADTRGDAGADAEADAEADSGGDMQSRLQ